MRPADTANRREILLPSSVFGRRWFTRGAIDWYESSEPGDPDRVSAAVYQQLLERHDSELFYLVDERGREPVLQVSDARSAAQLMVRMVDRARPGSPPVMNLVASRGWKMGEFVMAIGGLAGIPADRISRIDGDNVDHHWLFGTAQDVRVTDVLSALRLS